MEPASILIGMGALRQQRDFGVGTAVQTACCRMPRGSVYAGTRAWNQQRPGQVAVPRSLENGRIRCCLALFLETTERLGRYHETTLDWSRYGRTRPGRVC
jgi:hypothetical protein